MNDDIRGWAIVEMMGHRKLAGKLSPVELFGGLMRLEIPGIEQPVIIGSGAVFQITPVSEAFARERAEDYLRQSAYYNAQHLLVLLPEEKRLSGPTAFTPREIGIDYEVEDDDLYDEDDNDYDVGFYKSLMVDESDPVGDGADVSDSDADPDGVPPF